MFIVVPEGTVQTQCRGAGVVLAECKTCCCMVWHEAYIASCGVVISTCSLIKYAWQEGPDYS